MIEYNGLHTLRKLLERVLMNEWYNDEWMM